MKVGCDIFYLNRQPYLIAADYESHYPEIAILQNELAAAVIMNLKSILARHGIPHTLITDNGSHFATHSLSTLLKYGVSITSQQAHTIRNLMD